MLNAPEILTTERLLLRHPRLSDADAIFEYGSDPAVVHYMDYPPRPHVDAVVQSIKEHSTRWNAGNLSWVITVNPNDRPIGTIACSVEGHTADFGYLIHQNHWGQGFATEAAKVVAEWALSLPEVYRLWATCDVENLASARVLEKCGLVYEGRLRFSHIRPNISPAPRDALLYARIRGD